MLLLFVLVLAFALQIGGALVVARSLKKVSPAPTCANCGYVLKGILDITSNCPECGGALNESTMSDGEWSMDKRLVFIGLLILLLGAVAFGFTLHLVDMMSR